MLEARKSRRDLWAVAAVVGVAAIMRAWGLFHDLPFSFYGDELHFIKRSMALGTGDLNPHWFHKPAFLMYLLAFFYGIYYLVGALFGRFESVEAFGAHFLHQPGDFILIGRVVVALFGIATAYVAYRIARRLFRTRNAGVAAGITAGILMPMIASSQQVKADVPCGLLVALSLLWYMKANGGSRKRPLVIAALLAGAAMGTKYYGIILLPVFALGELMRRSKIDCSWNVVFARGGLILVLFVAGFFVTSPYNFLDSTWARQMTGHVEKVSGAGQAKAYDPDYRIEYEPGAKTVFGASGHLLFRFVHWHALGKVLAVLIVVGAVASLRRKAFRIPAGLVIATAMSFVLASVTLSPYHANARHFNAIYPVLCVFVWPGAMAVARLVRVPPGWRNRAAFAVCALALLPTLLYSIDSNVSRMQLDSRVASYRWIVDQLPRGEGILLDDYGPILQPNAAAVARQQQRMLDLGLGSDGFTRFHKIRLDLLEKHPAPEGFNLTELGHPWWLPREATNEELRSDAAHRDMGNPLIDRLPIAMSEYWKAGVRYVITNSEAKGRYFFADQPPRTEAFPSWVAFYRSLKDHTLIKTFDPRDWEGKGPIVWIYQLTREGS